MLQTAQAIAFNPNHPNRSLLVRIVLDTGSQRSYVTDRVKRELSLKPDGQQSMSILTFGSTHGEPIVCDYMKMGLKTKIGETQLLTLYSVPTICEPISSHCISQSQAAFPHLMGLDLADNVDGKAPLQVDVLIGSDQYWGLITGEICRGSQGPVAIHTKLGWVLSGPSLLSPGEESSVGLMTHTLRVDGKVTDITILDERLKSFWELESFGIPSTDPTVYSEFQDTVQFKDGRYEVALPWKDPHPILPSNFQLSLKRLRRLLQRLYSRISQSYRNTT